MGPRPDVDIWNNTRLVQIIDNIMKLGKQYKTTANQFRSANGLYYAKKHWTLFDSRLVRLAVIAGYEATIIEVLSSDTMEWSREFLANSSMHGLKYIVHPRKRPIERYKLAAIFRL